MSDSQAGSKTRKVTKDISRFVWPHPQDAYAMICAYVHHTFTDCVAQKTPVQREADTAATAEAAARLAAVAEAETRAKALRNVKSLGKRTDPQSSSAATLAARDAASGAAAELELAETAGSDAQQAETPGAEGPASEPTSGQADDRETADELEEGDYHGDNEEEAAASDQHDECDEEVCAGVGSEPKVTKPVESDLANPAVPAAPASTSGSSLEATPLAPQTLPPAAPAAPASTSGYSLASTLQTVLPVTPAVDFAVVIETSVDEFTAWTMSHAGGPQSDGDRAHAVYMLEIGERHRSARSQLTKMYFDVACLEADASSASSLTAQRALHTGRLALMDAVGKIEQLEREFTRRYGMERAQRDARQRAMSEGGATTGASLSSSVPNASSPPERDDRLVYDKSEPRVLRIMQRWDFIFCTSDEEGPRSGFVVQCTICDTRNIVRPQSKYTSFAQSLRNHRRLYCATGKSKDTPLKRKATDDEDDEVQLSHVSFLLTCPYIQMCVRRTIA